MLDRLGGPTPQVAHAALVRQLKHSFPAESLRLTSSSRRNQSLQHQDCPSIYRNTGQTLGSRLDEEVDLCWTWPLSASILCKIGGRGLTLVG